MHLEGRFLEEEMLSQGSCTFIKDCMFEPKKKKGGWVLDNDHRYSMAWDVTMIRNQKNPDQQTSFYRVKT